MIPHNVCFCLEMKGQNVYFQNVHLSRAEDRAQDKSTSDDGGSLNRMEKLQMS